MNSISTAVTRRVWTLLCDGVATGFYTDHCRRGFAAGDMLRDDRDLRRRVLAVISEVMLVLEVSRPDGFGATADG